MAEIPEEQSAEIQPEQLPVARIGSGAKFSGDADLEGRLQSEVKCNAAIDQCVLHRGRALLLDDDAAVGEVLSGMLTILGFSVTSTIGYEDFFSAYQADEPDLIVVDLFLSDGDGLDILRTLGSTCTSKIIVTSGAGPRLLETARQTAEAYGLQVLGRLEKPFRIADVRALVMGTSTRVIRENCIEPDDMIRFLGEEISASMDKGEFQAHFQPKISSRSGLVIGFEALARWHNANWGILSPLAFLPAVEKAGLTDQLTTIILDQACSFAAELLEPSIPVAINAPVSTCGAPSFLKVLDSVLARHSLGPEHLVVEVTEAGTTELSQELVEQLTRLRMRGFRLSLDDFGTGQSSLHRMVKVPFDELKIDKSFVHNASSTHEGRHVILALVSLAKAFGMSVVAEGVESSSVAEMMCDLGCDMLQGHFIAPPMCAFEAKLWLTDYLPRFGSGGFAAT